MKKILVTGSNGQLGNEMRQVSKSHDDFEYVFTDIEELDICNYKNLDDFVLSNNINIIINCAAYTAVDKAENDKELCYEINYKALQNIGEVASKYQIKVIHISTDYVFDGTHNVPYTEEDNVCPYTVYGKSKLAGEQILIEKCKESVIIRTSWLYSSFGNNFVKTMIKLGTERDSLNVIYDQVGTPTYAADLATAIMKIISAENFVPGIFHYSNEGVCSWYDFTISIHKLSGISCEVNPIESKLYPTPTPRPHFSVLNKSKIKSTYKLSIPHWEKSLAQCISLLT